MRSVTSGTTDLRLRLLDEAARIIATEGARGLSLRRLAAAAGTSTMAIYTHFGGMPELRRAVRQEGFSRLASRLDAIERSNDPVADVCLQGLAYYENAIANPELYRVMFLEQPLDTVDSATGWDTFGTLVAAVQRCYDAGRFRHGTALSAATELWGLAHGLVSLRLAHLLTDTQALEILGLGALNLFTGFGAPRSRTKNSFHRALTRRHPGASSEDGS